MQTIGNAIQFEIEQYARSLVHSNALFRAAEKGALTPEQVKIYISGILFQIRGSLKVLRRAERLASATGDHALAAHYRLKFREECGHDRWAERDLKSLRGSYTEYECNGSMRALKDLIAYLNQVIDLDPCLFLSYLLLSEYLTVLAGPAWLEALEGKCGIPRNNVSVVANHIELDREHVIDGVREIDVLIASPDKREAMLDVVAKSIAYYDRFWSEILLASPMAA
ncbi:MAG TPA: hypothetical protein VNZ26_20575 [Vicinamibacterales bacterium]|nr:hypothetical protein [Vicinamibacterales bacterium]